MRQQKNAVVVKKSLIILTLEVEWFPNTATGQCYLQAEADPRQTIDVTYAIDVSRTVEAFDPTQAQTAGIATVLSAPTTMSLRLIDRAGAPVRTLAANVRRNPGHYTDVWNGRNDAGQVVPDGVYYFILDYNVDGQTRHVDLTNTADPNGHAPAVTYPLTFNPIEDRPFYAQYSAAKPFEATVYVCAAPDGAYPAYVVRTIVMREPRKSGTHAILFGTVHAHPQAGRPLQYLCRIFTQS
jgi:hypothetical protein